MKIDEKNTYFWTGLGFKIGRLEFLWDSPYKECQDEFESAEKEILNLLDAEVPVKESSYPEFAESIVYHYMKNDIEKFSLLMIGRCIQRCGLLKACKDDKTREMMTELARGCLTPIPSFVVKDQSSLFSLIKNNSDKSLAELTSMIYKIITSGKSNVSSEFEKRDKKTTAQDKYIFVSYSSKDYDVAENIKSMLEDKGISCWMAPSSIPVGADYSEVIVDAIEGSSGVLLVLTENSQESKWVPKELDIAITADKSVFPVHMDSSKINKKIHFRITDSQVMEAHGDIDSIAEPLAKAIQTYWNK